MTKKFEAMSSRSPHAPASDRELEEWKEWSLDLGKDEMRGYVRRIEKNVPRGNVQIRYSKRDSTADTNVWNLTYNRKPVGFFTHEFSPGFSDFAFRFQFEGKYKRMPIRDNTRVIPVVEAIADAIRALSSKGEGVEMSMGELLDLVEERVEERDREELVEYADRDEAMRTIMHYGWTKAEAKKILKIFMDNMLEASAFVKACRKLPSSRKGDDRRVSWGELHHQLYNIFEDASWSSDFLSEKKGEIWYVSKRGGDPYAGPSLKKAGLKTSVFGTEAEAEAALKKLVAVNPAFSNASVERATGEKAARIRREIQKWL